jgi:hypothetical protein
MNGYRLAATAALVLLLSAPALGAETDWKKLDEALGRQGTMQPGDVYKFSFPRSDLKVTLDGVPVKSALALGSWVAFMGNGDHATVMGDLVLTEDEVAPVMKQLVQDGLDVTAIHNHILRASPVTLYMHIAGTGDAAKLGNAIHGALGKSKTPLDAVPASNQGAGQDVGLDTAALDQALGQKGKASGGVYQFSIPRAEPVKEGDMEVPPAMGTAIAINFQSAGEGKAATTGDFVLLPEEVNPVLQTLLANGIEVTALHTHMLGEQPRLYFMHFWGVDQPEKLANGLKEALAKANVSHS